MNHTTQLFSPTLDVELLFSTPGDQMGDTSTEPSNITVNISSATRNGGRHHPGGYRYIIPPELSYYYYLLETTRQLWRVFPPILMLVGTLGNAMAIAVLSRKPMRRSNTAIYLIALAVVDTLVLYTGLLRQWMVNHFHTDVRSFGSLSCKIHAWLVYTILDMSVWFLVVLTLERLVSVYFPHRVKRHCTALTAFIILGIITVVLLAVNSHFLHGFDIRTNYRRSGNTTVTLPVCTNMHVDYEHFFVKVWPWIDLCMYSFLPFTIIVICNSAIVFKVLLSRREARRIRPTATVTFQNVRFQDADSRKVSSMTAMLVVVNVALLVTTAPISVYQIVRPYVISTLDDTQHILFARLNLWWAVVNCLQYTNNSINFVLYCLSGSRFREELRAMFGCSHRVSPLSANNTNLSEGNLTRFRQNGNSPSTRQTDYNINTTTMISPSPRTLQLPLESWQELSQDDQSPQPPHLSMTQLSLSATTPAAAETTTITTAATATRRPSQYQLDLALALPQLAQRLPRAAPFSSGLPEYHAEDEGSHSGGGTSVEAFCDQLAAARTKQPEATAAGDDKGDNGAGSEGEELSAKPAGDHLVQNGALGGDGRLVQNDHGAPREVDSATENNSSENTN